MQDDSQIHIGTSGWNYNHWLGPFYPSQMDQANFLNYYSQNFRTVEINYTFYNLPDESVVEKWRKQVPGNFIFSVKASRYITHMKKLKDPESSTQKFIDRIKIFGNKMGPILFQLPPNWNINYERLQSFIEFLPSKYTYVFEFRDKRWINPQCLHLLKDYNISFCIYDLNGVITKKEITSDIIYVRLHGPGSAYEGSYTLDILKKWRDFFIEQINSGKQIYCYFNNDIHGFAPKNALSLIELMKGV